MSTILNDEDRLRSEFEKLRNADNTWDVSEEDEDAMRLALLADLEENSPYSIDEFNAILDKEFSVFKNGEKYNFVKDMKDAFREGLSKTTAQKIFETIPDHVFWDIKKPLIPDQQKFMSPYNPFRKYPYSSFFDLKDYDEFTHRRSRKENLRDAISLYRRY